MKRTFGASLIAASLLSLAGPAVAADGDTLTKVKERGSLNCTGHNGSFFGYAELDDQGNWRGIDIDLCRALSISIFGNDDTLNIVPISWEQRWSTLQAGDVDIVIKSSGNTFSRDTELGLQFTQPYLFGLTKVMVHADRGIASLAQADGGTVCIPGGTTMERQIASIASRLKIKLEPVLFEGSEEMIAAYIANRCDAIVEFDQTLSIIANDSGKPEAHIILPEVLAMEPQVIVALEGDENWVDINNWMLTALLLAEQEGVTSANVDEMKANPPSSEVGKLLGATPGMGTPLGLNDDWAYNVIKQMGNYGEIYSRNLGDTSVYKTPRSFNALWNAGGLLYPMILD